MALSDGWLWPGRVTVLRIGQLLGSREYNVYVVSTYILQSSSSPSINHSLHINNKKKCMWLPLLFLKSTCIICSRDYGGFVPKSRPSGMDGTRCQPRLGGAAVGLMRGI